MMRAALALARRSLGRTWPNPAVGCIIVNREGDIIGRGRTQDGGRPHAEVEALRQAGPSARGATVYVTLEPCSHHGKSAPCVDELIAASVAKVVSAMEDPFPEVNGRGHARLRAAGIAVDVGEDAAEAAEINAGFLLRVKQSRPLFHLKLAASLDGRIATASGESKWITGEPARAHAHHLRATHDAVLVGAATAAVDDPDLTCRLPGLAKYSPVRIVLDSSARMSPASKLARSAKETPVWLVCSRPEKVDPLRKLGVEIIEVAAASDGGINVAEAARALGQRGLTRVLVEGGGEMAASFLKVGLVDRLSVYRAGLVLGGDGRSAVAALGLGKIDFAPRFSLASRRILGGDTLETWHRGT